MFLITPERFRAAESVVVHRASVLGAELEVTPRVVEAWRRWWLIRGQFVHADLLNVEALDG